MVLTSSTYRHTKFKKKKSAEMDRLCSSELDVNWAHGLQLSAVLTDSRRSSAPRQCWPFSESGPPPPPGSNTSEVFK